MFSIRQILAPVVFSPQCVWSGRYADHLAKKFDSQLIFLQSAIVMLRQDWKSLSRLKSEHPDIRQSRSMGIRRNESSNWQQNTGQIWL
jgi:hypothetical protein